MNYYSVTDDFGGISPNILQLETEIQDYINNNPSNITPNYVTITKYLSLQISLI